MQNFTAFRSRPRRGFPNSLPRLKPWHVNMSTSCSPSSRKECTCWVDGWLKGSDYSLRQLQFSQSLFSALHRYIPKPYGGRVVAYQSKTEPLYHLLEVDRCWRKLSPQVEIVQVKGTHVSLIDRFHVDPIAQHLAQRLKEFRTGTTESRVT